MRGQWGICFLSLVFPEAAKSTERDAGHLNPSHGEMLIPAVYIWRAQSISGVTKQGLLQCS